jgi:hypothetical protein
MLAGRRLDCPEHLFEVVGMPQESPSDLHHGVNEPIVWAGH